MLKKVHIRKTIREADILKYASAKERKQLDALAKKLKGKKVVHVNATETGGGVAELLSSFIPYLRAFGVRVEWYVIDPATARRFFAFTNKLHNAFQGDHGKFTEFTEKDWKMYHRFSGKIAKELKKINHDVLVIHDPQVLVAGCLATENGDPKIFFNHIDTSSAHEHLWKRVLPHIKEYDRIVFSNKEFIHAGLPKKKVKTFTPAIDPLALKQQIVPQKKAKQYLSRFGIDPKRPLIVQVSRFDIWKNPLGVIEAFRMVQQRANADIQLALLGFNDAKDNPDATGIYHDAMALAKNDPNIFLFFDPGTVPSVAKVTMLAQNAADIVVQNSTKEGFGLTVTEAMWKEKPVIGGPASGIRKQIKNGKNGYIANNAEELARHIMNLLKYPKKRKKIGKAAKARVRKHFLFPRFSVDNMRLYVAVLKKD